MTTGLEMAVVVACLTSMGAATPDTEVKCDPQAPSAVRLACERLRERLRGNGAGGTIRLTRTEAPQAELGDEGYAITSSGQTITVRANSDAGLANGVYTLLRTMLIENLRSPFDRTWDVLEKPVFRIRSMMVAPYSFGGQHGFSVFSPDTWAFKHWKDYIDYLRLFNLNQLGIYSMRLYDPEIPETWPNKERYAIWKQAMEYAQSLGMEFTWVQTANHVHQETWWRYPDLRTEHDSVWTGCALCYSKGRDVIRKTQRHTFEFFKDADHFMFMFSDGGGACYCDACSRDQAAVFLRMVEDAQQTLREVGSKADFVFWNWALGFWYSSIPAGIPDYLDRYPQVRQIQDNVFERLPKHIRIEDLSVVPNVFGGQRDTLKEAKERGFQTVTMFGYLMNPELPLFMFPQPRLKPMIEMIGHAKALGLDGVDGYRLAPHGRVLNDFVFMRLAWNPDLTAEQLVDEMAGYLTSNPDNRAKVAEAITALDRYWQEPHIVPTPENLALVEKASRLLDEAKAGEPSRQLEYLADLACLLPGIHRLTTPGISREEAEAVKSAMLAETTKRYILQGFGGTDYQWVQETRMYFNAFATMWAPGHALAVPLTNEVRDAEKGADK